MISRCNMSFSFYAKACCLMGRGKKAVYNHVFLRSLGPATPLPFLIVAACNDFCNSSKVNPKLTHVMYGCKNVCVTDLSIKLIKLNQFIRLM